MATFAPGPLRRLRRPAPARVTSVVFVLVLAGSSLLVVSTAHQGGRLVHQMGVHAIMAPAPASGAVAVDKH